MRRVVSLLAVMPFMLTACSGIIVCEADSVCTNCGLRLTVRGVTTEIFRY